MANNPKSAKPIAHIHPCPRRDKVGSINTGYVSKPSSDPTLEREYKRAYDCSGKILLNHACMRGPLDARIKNGKPTETMSNLKISKIGVLTSFGFQLGSGIIGEVHLNERKARNTIAKLMNEM